MAKKCLIVDDVEVSRYASRIALDELGVEADEVDSAAACMASIESNSYDVFLLDWHLRRDCGLTLIARIRATSGYEKTPVIICSGVAEGDARQQAEAAGASSFHEKPTTKEKLEAEFKKLGLI